MIDRKSYLKKRIFIFMLIGLFIINNHYLLIYGKESSLSSKLYSISAAVIDGDSGRVLFEKNGNVERAMASTTKIMTLILALENGDLNSIVTVSSYASKMPDVQLNIKEGEKYYLKDLLYSLILESHNDVAVAIAEHIAGDVKSFADMMNKKAKELDLKNTYFITPNGLDEKDDTSFHHTTAIELAKIMKYCVFESKYKELFIDICQCDSWSFKDLTGKRNFSVFNHNAFLKMYDGVLAGKTGFTAKAGYCYVCATNIDGEKQVVALLGAGWPNNKNYKWIDCRNILDYTYRNYSYKEIINNSFDVKKICVIKGIEDGYIKPLIKNSYGLLVEDKDIIKLEVNIPKEIIAPIEKDIKVGSVNIYLNGEVVESIPLYSDRLIHRINYRYYIIKLARRLLFIQ